jgi:hypothetical protein
MIPHRVHVISPYLKDKTRLIALSSGSKFGYNVNIHDEHMIERLNNVIGNLGNTDIYQRYDFMRNMEMPDLTREKVVSGNVSSDILLIDTFRQHNEINERYRKKFVQLHDIRRLSEGATRYHIASSRGYERHLVDFISRLDTEMLDRSTIKPIIKNINY